MNGEALNAVPPDPALAPDPEPTVEIERLAMAQARARAQDAEFDPGETAVLPLEEHRAPTTDEFDDDKDPATVFAKALAEELQLSDLAIEKINEVMISMNTTFVDAGERLQILDSKDVEQALIRIREKRETEEPGLFESAINRISSDRRVVLRQGDAVTPSPALILAHDPDCDRSERLRALRTELLLLHETGRGANIVSVLSAARGEGRSQLAAELAISFAQLGRRTLLVDADMRKPKQHELFGSTNIQGLATSLARNEKPYFHPVVGIPFMSLLPSGPVPKNPLELLSDGRFTNLLNDWRNSYEFIVIDTPPVNLYADALAIATMAARALVVSRAQHSTYTSTKALLRRLATTQSKILGAVINHF